MRLMNREKVFLTEKMAVIAVAAVFLLFSCKEDVRITGVGLDRTALTLTEGQTAELKATVEPANAAVRTVRWSAEPANVLKLTDSRDGRCTVTALEDGSATVTVTTVDGEKTDVCRVKVGLYIENKTFITAVEKATDAGGHTVVIGWNKEEDGTVKLTPENTDAMKRVTELNLSGAETGDLSDVKWFTGLTYLDCSGNRLTALDVSSNSDLKTLICSENSLTSLDLKENVFLEVADCSSNELTTLDVSSNSDLKTLICSYNSLTSLDLKKNGQLEVLRCSYNRLTTLDLSDSGSLTELSCRKNNLTSLNVSGCPNLENLDCGFNCLEALNTDNNTGLKNLCCDENRLSSLNVGNNTVLWQLSCVGNRLSTLDVTLNFKLIGLWCGNQTDGTTLREMNLTMTAEQKATWDSFWSLDTDNTGVVPTGL